MSRLDRGTTKIALYGSAGRVARPILDEALTRGHEVTAITRNPDAAPFSSHANLRIEQGDILVGVADVVRDHDVVINAIGPPRGSDGRLLIEAAHSLIRGLRGASIRRLLIVGGAGTLESRWCPACDTWTPQSSQVRRVRRRQLTLRLWRSIRRLSWIGPW